jgi:type IV conjugative transfer system coupling protein TraD
MMNDPKEQSIKNFTRGGQIILHNTRMTAQIMSWVSLFCLIVFLICSVLATVIQTSSYERYLIFEWGQAKTMSSLIGRGAKQKIKTKTGKETELYSTEVLHSDTVKRAINKAMQACLYGVCIGGALSMIGFFVIFSHLKRRGQEQSETKKLRGDEIADIKAVKKLIHQTRKISNISIAKLPMPKNFEVSHVFIHGTIGSGKSVLIRQLLDQIRERGDRAIIYDKGCDFVPIYYRENKDVILNPLDERGSSWHLWNECRDFADYDSMAAALMPMPSGSIDPFWINAARTIFAASARQMQKKPDRSIIQLLKTLLTADLETMGHFLRGTEAETLVSEKIQKTAISIKSVLATCLKSLKYIKDEENPFSIRNWVTNDDASNWLFVSSLADRHETLKPLITLWLDIAINSLMSLTSSQDRRIWIILDELPTLNKLPYLINAFAETRKFGGCLVAGLQSIAQLREIYGFNGAEAISGLCNSKFFFCSPSFNTADWVSKELGCAELEEVKEGISYSESAMRSGISIAKHQTNRQVVGPSEIMRLKNLESYVRLPGGFPITKISLEFKDQEKISKSFIARKIDERNFNEINTLIESAENISHLKPVQSAKITAVEKDEALQW